MARAPDRYTRLQAVARRASQRGHFTTEQAQAAGWSRMQLNRGVRDGSVQRAAWNVYRFRVRAALDWKDHLAVELLSTRGLACGLTATALYGLNAPPAQPQVLSSRGSRHATTGRHHSSRDLPPYDCVTAGGFPSLAPIRAVLDAAHRVSHTDAISMVESAIVRGLVKPGRLEQRARELRHNKRPGCAVVLGILSELHPELSRSRNEWEALVARRAIEFGLPPPELEFEIVIDGRRYILDAAWPNPLATLEFDGRDPHMRREVHDYDTVRRNDLTSAGWRRFGITAAALKRGDDRVFRQLAAVLATANERSGTTRASHA